MKTKKLILFILILAIFAACTPTTKDVVVSVGQDQVLLPEFNVYLYNTKIAFVSIGEEDIWETDFGAQTTAESKAKEISMNSIVAVKLANQQAERYNVTLSEEEVLSAHEEAQELWQEMQDGNHLLDGVDLDLLYQIMEEKAIYLKVFEEVTKSFSFTDSDFEAYFEEEKDRFTSLGLLAVLFQEVDSAKQFLDDVKAGGDFETLAAETEWEGNRNLGNIIYNYGDFDEDFDAVAYTLDIFQVGLVDSDRGYYVIKLLGKAPDETNLRKTVEIAYAEENKNRIFQQELNKWQSNVSIIRNDEVWESISVFDADFLDEELD